MDVSPRRSSRWYVATLLCLGIQAGLFSYYSSLHAGDPWNRAGREFLIGALSGLAAVVVIWMRGFSTELFGRAARDTAVLVLSCFLLGEAGDRRRLSALRPTMDRAEALAAAAFEYRRTHGRLPPSLEALESLAAKTAPGAHPIRYEPRPDGSFTLTFQPDWYSHEYSSVSRSWRAYD